MSSNQKEKKDAGDQFAQTEEEGRARFKKYKSKDPFPSIKPSLLNSADISDYVAQTGMLVPFYEGKLKPASYEVNLLGKVIYWDDEGKRHYFDLKSDKEFILEKNSIAFVTPEPTFLLPDYIAIRFNLKITYVERGILLGTGPLVDPGFEGKLLIPLHNLTNNSYILKGGEGFIWAEFTKISKIAKWTEGMQDLNSFGKYIQFQDSKKYLKPENLIEKALEGQDSDSIRSSIPLSMMEASESAKEASKSARVASESANKSKEELSNFRKTWRHKVTFYGILSTLAVCISLFILYFSVNGLIRDVSSHAEKSTYLISDARKDIDDFNNQLDNQIESMNSLISRNSVISQSQEEEIENLKKEIQDLKSKFRNLQKPSEISEISTSGTAKPQD